MNLTANTNIFLIDLISDCFADIWIGVCPDGKMRDIRYVWA